MNPCKTKSVTCLTCGKLIGEVDSKAKIVLPRCWECSTINNDDTDVFSYLADRFERSVGNLIIINDIKPLDSS